MVILWMATKMKIIFQDVDGPLLPARAYVGAPTDPELPHLRRWDPVAVRMLRALWELEPENIRFVVASNWGYSLGARFIEQWVANQLGPEMLHPDWLAIGKLQQVSPSRSAAIHSWLAWHPNVETWVAIDDLPVHNNPVPKVDGQIGITLDLFNHVREALGHPPMRRIVY